MTSGKIDWVRISAIFGILASLGGMAGFLFSKDTQRCVGLGGAYRGHPLRALTHCTDDHAVTTATIGGTSTSPPDPSGTNGDPRRLGGTRWVFYVGDVKTLVTFDADGTVTFSNPSYGTGGVWELAGSRGVAFHTDTYDFGGTIGRGVPDSFDVSYRRIPSGSPTNAEQKTTLRRLASVASSP